MSGMYKSYATDKERERSGILLKYPQDNFRVTIARAGGANKRFDKVKERIAKPHQRSIDTGRIEPETVDLVLMEVYAEAVVLNWEVIEDGADQDNEANWKQGIEGPKGEVLPFNKENVFKTFKNLKSVFDDIRSQAEKEALFLLSLKGDNAKN